jgi:hypothetical protein
MHAPETILLTIQRAQRLRAEAQRLWWQAQAARQLLADGQQAYAQLMLRHELLLRQIRQVLAGLPDDAG